MTKIVTRFAPSPTGYLHIGGARTALFNFLYARKMGGKFLLRIEDTDRERSSKSAVDAIINGLDWLGLKHDGEIVFQSERAKRHAEIAYELLARGKAFKCYMNEEETNKAREVAMENGGALRSIYRDFDDEREEPFVIRIRAPKDESEIVIDDKVQGKVTTRGKQIDDFILLRSDGTPTYMLAVVVDDFDMGVTQIIRGDDHLTNAARQSVIIDGMDWPKPQYAHIPLIHGEDGKKLSKRHGALAVGEYANMGYLPEALDAYLLRLGWAKGDLDIVSLEEAKSIFDLEGLGKSPSRLDFAKLAQVNAHFMKIADDARLFELVLRQMNENTLDEANREIVKRGIPILKTRAKTLIELLQAFEFAIQSKPMQIDEKAAQIIKNDSLDVIKSSLDCFKSIENWNSEIIKNAIGDLANSKSVGMGKIGPVVRAAISGGKAAPDLADALYILGQNETLVRLESAIN